MRRLRWMNSLVALLVALAPTVPAQAATGDQAWVEMAPGGASLVRVVTTANTCPLVKVDGQNQPMTVRAAPAVLPVRSNKAEITTPTSFAQTVCEMKLPRLTRWATIGGQPLAVPKPRFDRIVLIGDTGCRLKATDKAWQSCNDLAQWPFAEIAARAAALMPDLVVHVGDYLYRENPCPAGQAGCTGSVWGYGGDGWTADFLVPAAPLLTVSPWVMVRGNHEECARAGQGWWRLLDPHPLQDGSDCRDPANDSTGNHTDPYAVKLGGGADLVVADLIQLASGKPDDSGVADTFQRDMAQIEHLSHGAKDVFVTAHYPLNAVVWAGKESDAVTIGTRPVNGFTVPPLPHVRAMLAGHIHLFQYARFVGRPSQVITGFSGTYEDPAIAPASLSEAFGKQGAGPLSALTTIAGQFGYALLERREHDWRLTTFAADGTILGRFLL